MKKNKSSTHDKFNSFVTENRVFKEKTSVLAAISGGQDSICLLKLLKDYKKHKKLEVHVIYFDHRWRRDSNNNSYFIKNITDRWSMVFHYERSNALLSENEARIWRYSKMQDICKSFDIKYIATGHTHSDRIETMFLNMIRGSGFEGIQTIQPFVIVSDNITIIHPLIEMKREDTSWFCRRFSLPVWSDTTNYQKTIQRNRIREELIPYFQQYLNINLNNTFANFVKNIGHDLDYLQHRTYYLYYKYRHPKYVGINKKAFSYLPFSMKKRLIRSFVYQNIGRKLDFEETSKYLSFINSPRSGVIQLSLLWCLCVSRDWVYLVSKKTKYEMIQRNNATVYW